MKSISLSFRTSDFSDEEVEDKARAGPVESQQGKMTFSDNMLGYGRIWLVAAMK
jgi:hypothetical protein